MTIDADRARALVDRFVKGLKHAHAPAALLPQTIQDGKAYEALVLSDVLKRLARREGYSAVLHNAAGVTLRTSGGEIDPGYPRFELTGRRQLTAWTDIWFNTLSYTDHWTGAEKRGHYHELDILVVDAGTTGKPTPEQVRIGVECKATDFRKEQLRAILGVRRELSYFKDDRPTIFPYWPRASVPAHPPSCLIFCSIAANLGEYRDAAETFGVDFVRRRA